jgi:hypothetical protein
MKEIFLLFGIVFLFTVQAFACDIKFNLVSGKKDAYKDGDIVTVEVQVRFSHRNCPESIKNSKFSLEGLEIKGATEWKEVSTSYYTRQLQIKVTNNAKNSIKLGVTRTCNKEGGYGVFTLQKDK